MIDVSDLMTDPDFASPYQVVRRRGEWVKGRFVLHEPETLQYCGPVQPATPAELEQLSEGDRKKEVMEFYCKSPRELHLTQTGENAGLSDLVLWRGNRYKLVQLFTWLGWMRALGCRLEEEEDEDAEDDGTA